MRRGFSLVELLIVIVVIGILAVGAYPLIGTDSEAEVATRQAELVSLLRLQQLTAMQNTGTTTGYGVEVSTTAITSEPVNSDITVVAPQNGSFTITQAGTDLGQPTLLFDSLGCPYISGGSTSPALLCAETSGFQMTVIGATNRLVCVEPQGYIHTASCQ